MKEKITIIDLIDPFKLDIVEIEIFVSRAFKKTGLKWWIQFNGSKGYLDNIEFWAEGQQPKQTNRIEIRRNTKTEYLVSYSTETGVHII